MKTSSLRWYVVADCFSFAIGTIAAIASMGTLLGCVIYLAGDVKPFPDWAGVVLTFGMLLLPIGTLYVVERNLFIALAPRVRRTLEADLEVLNVFALGKKDEELKFLRYRLEHRIAMCDVATGAGVIFHPSNPRAFN